MTADSTQPVAPSAIDASCRSALVVLLLSAGAWALIGSVFSLIASLQFHAPGLFADCAWMTYGRVRPAGVNALLYGFAMQAGLGVALWLFARLGHTPLATPLVAVTGATFWNLGVLIGIVGLLAGDSTGFELLEMPRYAALALFTGYVLLGASGALTFHRRERTAFVSQWFLFAALFWFPWIYSTAELLLACFPVRGVVQSVVAWWYGDNLLVVWLGLVGIAGAFYFVPKLTGRELHSHYLALLTFWMLILCGGWSGILQTAPVPAWMPAVSAVATVLMVIPILSFALNAHGTLNGNYARLRSNPSLAFIGFGGLSFIVAGLMKVLGTLLEARLGLHFTWFTPATTQLHLFGFFAMTMFGAVYYILPLTIGADFPWAKLVRTHFWLAAIGVLLGVTPLALGGVVEALRFADANVAFIDVVKATLPFLRASTLGELLIVVGNALFVANLAGLVARFYRTRAVAAYAAATADLKLAEVKE